VKDKRKVSRKASKIAKWLNSHATHKSHGRRISMADLQNAGVKVLDMKTDPKLHELVWDVQYALDHTFNGTGAIKIVEAANGRCIIRVLSVQQVVAQQPKPKQAPPPQPQPKQAPTPQP
jgi:hypothetical protein